MERFLDKNKSQNRSVSFQALSSERLNSFGNIFSRLFKKY